MADGFIWHDLLQSADSSLHREMAAINTEMLPDLIREHCLFGLCVVPHQFTLKPMLPLIA